MDMGDSCSAAERRKDFGRLWLTRNLEEQGTQASCLALDVVPIARQP
jgi:hypothetical protein